MKWVFLAFLLVLAPVLTAWLRTSPKQASWLWTLLTFLPFVIGPWHLGVAPYSTPTWSGYVKGWEATLLDCVAISVCLGMKGRWPKLYGLTPIVLYFTATLLACFQAPFGKLAISYVILLARVFVVFVAVARVASAKGGDHALIRGLVLGLATQALYAIAAKIGGATQTGGSLGHQNLLGFVSHMALMPLFAAFLAGRWPRLTLIGVVSGLICVALTASRGTIVLSGLGLVLTLTLTLLTGVTGRKLAIASGGAILLCAFIPIVQFNLQQRFAERGQQGLLEEDKERGAFIDAAKAMIADHPLGVGPNHYVFIANTQGYNDRSGVYWGSGSRSTSVHNSYLLVTAETGYLGITAFLLILVVALSYALRAAFRWRRYPGGELFVGYAAALIATSLHGLYEWMYLIEPSQYLFGGTIGSIAGLISKLQLQHGARTAARPQSQQSDRAAVLTEQQHQPGSASLL